jgi:hypothetical protein
MRTIIIKTDFEIFQQQEVKITKKQKKIMEDDMERISKVLNQSINYYESMFWMRKYNELNNLIKE